MILIIAPKKKDDGLYYRAFYEVQKAAEDYILHLIENANIPIDEIEVYEVSERLIVSEAICRSIEIKRPNHGLGIEIPTKE